MPLFHIDAETFEHLSTHRAMEKLSQWFNPASGNEGGNYVLTRNDSNYIGGTSIIKMLLRRSLQPENWERLADTQDKDSRSMELLSPRSFLSIWILRKRY